jgi:hypothetical protein
VGSSRCFLAGSPLLHPGTSREEQRRLGASQGAAEAPAIFEVEMTVSDIELEMQLNGVDEADVASILAACHTKGYAPETLDDELEKRGYERIFTFDFDDNDDWGDDDAFEPIERFPHKHRFDDE